MKKQYLFFAEERYCSDVKQKFKHDLFTLIQDHGQV